jgi:hypothetical protein
MKIFELEKDGKKCNAQDDQVSVMEKSGWKKTGVVSGVEDGKKAAPKKAAIK